MIETNSERMRTKARAQQIESCSFDVFDTFLLRSCTTPDGVFERAFLLSRVAKTHPAAGVSYVQHRLQAEARARAFAKEKHGSFEVMIEDIYACFPFRLFDLDRTALQDLADAEYQAELDLCRVNDEILHLFQAAQRKGQRVGFISDTYWNERQLENLLRHCSPGLKWDFLYVSCAHGSSKSEKLFSRYLAAQNVDPSRAIHVGDNPNADIKSARSHGIRTRFYPQVSGALAAQFQRESVIFDLLCQPNPSRLDCGLRTLRRIVAAQTSERSGPFRLGITTLGPAMVAFDKFVEQRIAQLRRGSTKIAVAFLGRDGFLSHALWHDTRDEPAAYLEINRRVSLIGSATTIEPIVDLFRKVAKIDANTFAEMLKILPSPISHFFDRFPDKTATGKEFAEALPYLIDHDQIANIAAAMRASILAYLRHQIPDFDECSDLLLVDLGYSGSVQKALRRIFDCEEINIRIHGAYLMSVDDSYDDLAPDDTAEGFISDLIVTPHVKRMLTRNVALLEQMCCSPAGSVRDYRGNEVLRERNTLAAEQLALVAEIQSGALAFAINARKLVPLYKIDPFVSLDISARWTAAILGRLLLLPDDHELTMLGALQHDINLGTAALAPMVDGNAIKNIDIARGLLPACTALAPPMWLAGSFASLSPSLGYLYLLFGANRLPADIFGDIKCGAVSIGLFNQSGGATMETVAVYRNGMNDLRVRIPVSQTMDLKTIAVPLAKIASEGILQGVTAQSGKTAGKASENIEIRNVHDNRLTFAGLERFGHRYRAADTEGCLLIEVGPLAEPVTIFSIGLTSLSGDRILAPSDTREFGDDVTAALINPKLCHLVGK